jgi:hypothetical protein
VASSAHLDDVAKAGGEAFDLRFDPLGHVDLATVRHVAVRVSRVCFPFGARMRSKLLCWQTIRKRVIGRAAFPHRLLGLGDIFQRTADVHRRCAIAS